MLNVNKPFFVHFWHMNRALMFFINVTRKSLKCIMWYLYLFTVLEARDVLNESQEPCDSYVKVCATEQNDEKSHCGNSKTVVSTVFFLFSSGWLVSRF